MLIDIGNEVYIDRDTDRYKEATMRIQLKS
jgi:hypothetical protein